MKVKQLVARCVLGALLVCLFGLLPWLVGGWQTAFTFWGVMVFSVVIVWAIHNADL